METIITEEAFCREDVARRAAEGGEEVFVEWSGWLTATRWYAENVPRITADERTQRANHTHTETHIRANLSALYHSTPIHTAATIYSPYLDDYHTALLRDDLLGDLFPESTTSLQERADSLFSLESRRRYQIEQRETIETIQLCGQETQLRKAVAALQGVSVCSSAFGGTFNPDRAAAPQIAEAESTALAWVAACTSVIRTEISSIETIYRETFEAKEKTARNNLRRSFTLLKGELQQRSVIEKGYVAFCFSVGKDVRVGVGVECIVALENVARMQLGADLFDAILSTLFKCEGTMRELLLEEAECAHRDVLRANVGIASQRLCDAERCERTHIASTANFSFFTNIISVSKLYQSETRCRANVVHTELLSRTKVVHLFQYSYLGVQEGYARNLFEDAEDLTRIAAGLKCGALSSVHPYPVTAMWEHSEGVLRSRLAFAEVMENAGLRTLCTEGVSRMELYEEEEAAGACIPTNVYSVLQGVFLIAEENRALEMRDDALQGEIVTSWFGEETGVLSCPVSRSTMEVDRCRKTSLSERILQKVAGHFTGGSVSVDNVSIKAAFDILLSTRIEAKPSADQQDGHTFTQTERDSVVTLHAAWCREVEGNVHTAALLAQCAEGVPFHEFCITLYFLSVALLRLERSVMASHKNAILWGLHSFSSGESFLQMLGEYDDFVLCKTVQGSERSEEETLCSFGAVRAVYGDAQLLENEQNLRLHLVPLALQTAGVFGKERCTTSLHRQNENFPQPRRSCAVHLLSILSLPIPAVACLWEYLFSYLLLYPGHIHQRMRMPVHMTCGMKFEEEEEEGEEEEECNPYHGSEGWWGGGPKALSEFLQWGATVFELTREMRARVKRGGGKAGRGMGVGVEGAAGVAAADVAEVANGSCTPHPPTAKRLSCFRVKSHG